MMNHSSKALLGALAVTALCTSGAAASQMDDAIASGAIRLTAEQVHERLADKTVTFENAISGAKALVYYDGRNGTKLKLLGSNQLLDGFYAFDLADHICLGVYGDAPMRLRCVNVLEIDGAMHKFELDGSLRGRIIEEVDGNMI